MASSKTVEKFLRKQGDMKEVFRIDGAYAVSELGFRSWWGDLVFLETAVCFVARGSVMRIPPVTAVLPVLAVSGAVSAEGGVVGGIVSGGITMVIVAPLIAGFNSRIRRKVSGSSSSSVNRTIDLDIKESKLRFAVKRANAENMKYEEQNEKLDFGFDDQFYVKVHIPKDVFDRASDQIAAYTRSTQEKQDDSEADRKT